MNQCLAEVFSVNRSPSMDELKSAEIQGSQDYVPFL